VRLISAVIPTYNRAMRVQRAIESVLEQTHHRVEVIVVDDGSTDGTADRVTDRYGDDERLHVIRTDNQGVARARNVGIEAATGDFVAFLDSDDEWFPWKLEFQLACLDRVEGAGMIWTDMRAVDPDGTEVARRYLRSFYHRYDEVNIADVLDGPIAVARAEFGTADLWHGDLYPAMLGGNLVHTSTVLMTRERSDVVRGFDEDLVRTGEDFDFHLRTTAVGPVAFADVPTITYRVGAPDQLTRPDLMVQMARNHLATIEKAIDADRGRTPDRDLRRVRAAAHGWLGEELLESGLGTQAAPHLRAAVRGPRGVRAAVLWTLTRLPERFGTIVKAGLGRITRPFRRRSAG
jgi:glycosyltransferase involved in cell wall biosynthesis